MIPKLAAAAFATAITFAGLGMSSAQAAPAAPAAVDSSVQGGGLLNDVRWVCGPRGRNCVWRGGPGPRFARPAPFRRCVTRVQRGPWGVRRVRTCR